MVVVVVAVVDVVEMGVVETVLGVLDFCGDNRAATSRSTSGLISAGVSRLILPISSTGSLDNRILGISLLTFFLILDLHLLCLDLGNLLHSCSNSFQRIMRCA